MRVTIHLLLLLSFFPLPGIVLADVVKDTLAAREMAAQGEFNAAVKKAESVLVDAQKSLGATHLYVAIINDDIAKYRLQLNQPVNALQNSEVALNILSHSGSEGKKFLSDLEFTHASVLAALGRYPESILLFRKIYDRFKQGGSRLQLATVSVALALALMEDDKPQDSIILLREVVEIYSQNQEAQEDYQRSMLSLSKAYLYAGLPQQSDKILQKLKKLTAANEKIATDVKLQQSRLLIQQSRFVEANNLLVSLLEKNETDSARASAYYNLGNLAILRGDPIAAERYFNRSLRHYEVFVDYSHPAVLRALHGLSLSYTELSNHKEAAEILTRVVERKKEIFGSDHVSVAASMSELSRVLVELGEAHAAQQVALEAVDISNAGSGLVGYTQAMSLSALAFAQKALGKLDDAVSTFGVMLEALTTLRGRNSRELTPGFIALADIHLIRSDYRSAAESIEMALETVGKGEDSTTDRYGEVLSLQARLQAGLGNCNNARDHVNSAVSLASEYSKKAAFSLLQDARSLNERALIGGLLGVLDDCRHAAGISEQQHNLYFRALQIPQLRSTASSLGKMAARLNPDNPALATLLKTQKRIEDQWRNLNSQLSSLQQGSSRTIVDSSKIDRQVQLEDELKEIRRKIESGFPGYTELVNPKAVSILSVQEILDDDEALLHQHSTNNKTYVFLIRKNAVFAHQSESGAADIFHLVENIRASVDLGDGFQLPRDYDYESAYKLYQILFESANEKLNGIQHIFLSLDGSLQRLPLSLLLTELPELINSSPLDYIDFSFLVEKYSLSVLPSPGSLISIRKVESNSSGRSGQRFLGVGDPVLPERKLGSAVRGVFDEYASSFTDVDLLRASAGRLANTANELSQIATVFPGNSSTILLQNRATETVIKDLNLNPFSVIVFATHGLMVDDLSFVREPSLVLTPPDLPTNEDDGLLTASEIAALEMNAEWVVLSACNTASTGTDIGADGLSGMAKSFFYAGARSILISHWAVDSGATEWLITNTIGNYAYLGFRKKAEALRSAMLAIAKGDGLRGRSHPAYWAAFDLVGDRN